MVSRTAALSAGRAEMLAFCRDLDESEWQTPSAAWGWRVHDVIAHLGSGCHALFTPAALKLLRSRDIERANDTLVDARRSWTSSQVLTELQRWSARAVRLSSFAESLPLGRVRMPLAELGRFPVPLLLGGALVFDLHTHLRYDMAPVLDRPVPGTDANRMAVVVEWMLAVLGNQLAGSSYSWLDGAVSLSLTGPGGGTWVLDRGGVRTGEGAGATAAAISSPADQFPEWATTRVPWRDRDIRITGDEVYGEKFLDTVNVI